MDTETGELIPIRYEADAALHFEGDGLGRAHSLGWRREQVEMLGWALMVNAINDGPPQSC